MKIFPNRAPLFEIWENLGSVECVLEEILEFKREISIMYFKSTDNSDGFFPISQNHHENGILRKTIAPTILNIDAEKLLQQLPDKEIYNYNYDIKNI